jgi:hypothetical protein
MLHVFFDGWNGVATNAVLLVFLAVEGALARVRLRRRRAARQSAQQSPRAPTTPQDIVPA